MAQAKKTATRPADLAAIGRMIQDGRLGDAFNSLQQFLRHNPYHGQALCLMGDILRAQGQLEPAQEYYQRSLSIQQSVPALKGLLGVAEARQDMERLFDGKVFLEIFVKVKSGWADDEARVKSFGYE